MGNVIHVKFNNDPDPFFLNNDPIAAMAGYRYFDLTKEQEEMDALLDGLEKINAAIGDTMARLLDIQEKYR